MKLLGCHIDNFGAFRDYDLSFNDGLNVIMQANGWGKTTLAAFVKAMLYGFESKRVRNVAENERLRYKPWQGGRYGGSLDFEANGNEYRVLRTFGATGAKDTIKIVRIDTGKSARSEIGEDIGEWLFGLDAHAFQKSVFVVQNGFGFDGSTTSLRNRLNSLVNEADDVAGFDKARAKLEERRKYYKKTGNRGEIADISKDITKLVDKDAQANMRIAELRRLGVEIDDFASSIVELDKRITDTRLLAEKDLAAAQQEQALLKVGGQLRQRQKDAEAAYANAMSTDAGKVPAASDIDEARQNISELDRLKKEVDVAQSAVKSAVNSRQSIAAKYPNGMPSRQELQDMREKVASLAAQEAAVAASKPEVDEAFEHLQASVMADPTLVERSIVAIAKLEEVTKAVAVGKTAEDELNAARAQWGEKRKRLAQLANESKDKMAAVSADMQEQIAMLQQDARELRAVGAEIAKSEVRCETLEAQLADEQAQLAAFSGGGAADAAQMESLDVVAKTVETATNALNNARLERDDKVAKLTELKLEADNAQAKVDKQRAEAAQAKPASPISAIVCFVIAIVVAIVGAMMGPVDTASFVLYAFGVVLAFIGVVLLVKRKPSVPNEPDAETMHAAEAAKNAYENAKIGVEQAESILSAAEIDTRKATDELVGIVGKLFPGEVFDDSSVVAQIPVLKQRLTAYADQEKRVTDVSDKIAAAKSELENLKKQAELIAVKHPEIPNGSYEDGAASMEAKASELASLEREAAAAKNRMIAAIAEEMGIDVASADENKIQTFLASIRQEEPPEAHLLVEKMKAAKATVDTYVDELNGLLSSFDLEGVDTDGLAVGAERLEKALVSYQDGRNRVTAAKQKALAQADALASAKNEIMSWGARVGVQSADVMTDELFEDIEADISADEKSAWEEKQARGKAEMSRRLATELHAKIDAFFLRFGIKGSEDFMSELDKLIRRTNEIADLKKASEIAQSELARWLSENQEAIESASARAKNPQSQDGASQKLELLRQQRDALVSDKAQREEQRSIILETLESRLAVQQELELLSKKRQTAITNLFTLQKTSELLQRAREGLDGRYLGDLADRFGDYANAWLDGEDIEAAVNSDFGVALYDGDVAHDVAGYSTGYQDLLDICFRMALVDTVFQAEPPFLIMDDPFASLDEEKIRRAFLLLETLASRYQIIYFTCHPSRMEAGEAVAGNTAFVLPEQRARRELPRARAKREAEERARAQAELVASYAVVPVTGGRASIVPQGRRCINNNLLNIEFAVDDSAGFHDNSFEVHFIDEKGRVLCDRQTVEVMGGRTVPDKVRFSLSTQSDSGSTYDLIIHEDGREPAELAARIPYTADVSFANDDFGW